MLPIAEPQIFPTLPEFSEKFNQEESQLVWTVCPADLDTPVSAMLRLMREDEPCFLLESVEKGEIRGRYSVIGIMPDLIWRCKGNSAEIAYPYRNGSSKGNHGFIPCEEGSLAALRKIYAKSQIDIPEELPPMSCGLVGMMGYDMVKLMEDLPSTKPDVIGIEDSCFIRPQIMVIFDAVSDKIFVIASVYNDSFIKNAQEAYNNAVTNINYVLEKLASPIPKDKKAGNYSALSVDDFSSNTTRKQYDTMLEKAREHIRAGDIFQVVLSQRFSAEFNLPPFALYRSLRQLNPSPFLFYLNLGGYTLVGSSPEILVRLRDGEVTIRPIAGTRKRGKNKAEDEKLAADLLSDPKELAEHLMLLDLGRNDVGRVAKIGSVKTTHKMTIENYSHVMHIVSNVTGEIDPKYDALSALIAGFPAGTVSGAPKVRAMGIIDELENESRSFYAGCIGYFSGNGNMDTCITLRTALVKDNKIYIQAGGGIVADSNNEDEYQEVLNKSRALMRAAQESIKFV